MDSIIFFLTGFTGLTGFFFACGESPFGRRPLYPDDPVDPVQLLFKDKNPFLFFAVLRYLSALYETTPKWHSFFFNSASSGLGPIVPFAVLKKAAQFLLRRYISAVQSE